MALFGNRNVKPNPLSFKSTAAAPATRQAPAVNGSSSPAPASMAHREDGVFELETGYTPPPEFRKVRAKIQTYLLEEVKSMAALKDTDRIRELIEPIFSKALAEEDIVTSRTERAYLFDLVMADIFGYGPIQSLLDRDDISEVMVNGPDQIYIEQKGKLRLTNVKFLDDAQVMQVIERIVIPLGRRIDEASPMVDARLPDGSRVNAIIPPLSLVGPCITIRKFRKDPLKIEDLIRFGSMTPEFAEFIRACVIGTLNIIVSGGTGSGKTTLLNVLSSFIPADERVVTIEDAAELQLQQPHVIRLEKRPANVEGRGEVTIRDLVVNSLRMRPDRIVVGEVRGGEALDMLQAMNTGHDGSLTTVHANSARDALNRLETMVLMAGLDLPLRSIRQQVASAVDIIVQVQRMRDGSRRVIQCSEVLGMEGETLVMQDIFMYEQTGIRDDGKLVGELRPTGLRPRASERIEAAGITLPPEVFGLKR
jgi:pilus assembly protein CpaF